MYIEKRKFGKSIKYYLVHSYRENKEIKKIRRYLGLNLSPKELEKRRKITESVILEIIEESNTELFNFSLSENQIKKLNEYEGKIKIHHLERFNWKRFTEDFVYNTNAIEGSTVQLDEVKEILEKKKRVSGSEEEETEGVAIAVKFIRETKEQLSLELIKKIHKICFEDSKPFAGQFRNVEVVIKNSKGEITHVGMPVSELNEELTDLINWYIKNKKKFKPLILAAIIHNQFEHIHPFQDGNGRVGRLLLNFILLKNKYPPINIKLEDRAEYYLSLQEYSKKHNLKPTVKFLIKQYNKTLRKVTTKNKNK
ncbi:MAG: Fic family protein [Nanoarchaeota archaeon]|nr:Fic family protein [Nanoarchaeota archaeon]